MGIVTPPNTMMTNNLPSPSPPTQSLKASLSSTGGANDQKIEGAMIGTIIEKLEDLHKQATTEHSHYYVAACCLEAIEEIKRLRAISKSKSREIERLERSLYALDDRE